MTIHRFPVPLGFLFLFLIFSLGISSPESAPQGLGLPLKGPRIVVKKSQRKLFLYSEQNLLRTYPIGLGFAPQGPKEKQGDGKTPEGNYFVVDKNPHSQFYLSLALNYPNAEDGRRGREQGLLSKEQNKKIINAAKDKTLPPWNTPLGGEIFIHGKGSGSDWTLGCIALDDVHMKELFEAIPVGTAVEILPD